MTRIHCHLEIALVHYPVYNKRGDIVSTSITPFDVHDIARTAKTFGVKRYWLVCPMESQKQLALRMMGHWQEGRGASFNPNRKEAFDIIEFCPNLEQACLTIENELGIAPRLIGTSAKLSNKRVEYQALRKELSESDRPHLLLFGTGWGMAAELMDKTDAILAPVGEGSYNHLPVRAAVAIILDRIIDREEV